MALAVNDPIPENRPGPINAAMISSWPSDSVCIRCGGPSSLTTPSDVSISRGHPRFEGSTMPGASGYGTGVGPGIGIDVGRGVGAGNAGWAVRAGAGSAAGRAVGAGKAVSAGRGSEGSLGVALGALSCDASPQAVRTSAAIIAATIRPIPIRIRNFRVT